MPLLLIIDVVEGLLVDKVGVKFVVSVVVVVESRDGVVPVWSTDKDSSN